MSKNINKVREMLKGNFKPKTQVGYGDQEAKRKRYEGEKWTDLEGVEWEQKKGFISKVKSTPDVGIFSKQCKDCKKNCSRLNSDKRHFETWKRTERCFHCQLNWEVDLKSKRIGKNGNKWQFWVKLQMLQRWEAIDREVKHLVFHNSGVKHHDKALLNALANENERDAREKIKKSS
tara:strand:- start:46 stop:573 length:528 start_codon:yes stop_codon:yes gene_type:complete